jgi:hypothetical protein
MASIARHYAQFPNDTLDLAATLSRMAGVASFQPKNILDLSRAQAGAAQINPEPKECLVPALSWGTLPLPDRHRPTLRAIVLHLPLSPYRDHLARRLESVGGTGAATVGATISATVG